jgi:hypothetical protein
MENISDGIIGIAWRLALVLVIGWLLYKLIPYVIVFFEEIWRKSR